MCLVMINYGGEDVGRGHSICFDVLLTRRAGEGWGEKLKEEKKYFSLIPLGTLDYVLYIGVPGYIEIPL
jgi:hypothetical protein